MEGFPDRRDGIAPHDFSPVLTEEVRELEGFVRIRGLEPVQERDICPREIDDVDLRPDGEPFPDVAGVAVLEGEARQGRQLDGQAVVFAVPAVDQRWSHDGQLCAGGAQSLRRVDDRQIDQTVRRRVREGGELVLPVVRVDLVALELALRVVADQAGAAGVDEDRLLVVLGPTLDAIDDGLHRR